MRRGALLLLVVVLAAAAACRERSSSERAPVRVAAASDLSRAFEELGRVFEASHGVPVSFTFGSSGLLSKQVQEGAPFDVFAAANEAFVDAAVDRGACDGRSRALYAEGRIGVWTGNGGPTPPAALEELAQPRFVRVAIAHPEHAPYGLAARQALAAAGAWDAVAPRVIHAENVRQALQFAQTGNAEAAIVAASLAGEGKDGAWLPIAPSLHAPLRQALVVCGNGRNTAGGRAFAAYVRSAGGRAVLARHGFVEPAPETGAAP